MRAASRLSAKPSIHPADTRRSVPDRVRRMSREPGRVGECLRRRGGASRFDVVPDCAAKRTVHPALAVASSPMIVDGLPRQCFETKRVWLVRLIMPLAVKH